MELLQLQYFFDTARTENFAKTAEKYMVPPSSVSASVKRLERELGCSLFDRYSNRIVLNENGRKLQGSLGIIFDELNRTCAELSHTEERAVEIKILVRSLRSQITDAIIRYRETHPHVIFKAVFDLGDHNVDSYDVIIDEKNDSYMGYTRFELCRKNLCFRVARDNPLCGRPITLLQLRNQPFVTMGADSNLHKILLHACKNAGFAPHIVMEIDDALCYGKCISSGVGIGLSRASDKRETTSVLQVTDFDECQIFYAYYTPETANHQITDFLSFLKNWEL